MRGRPVQNRVKPATVQPASNEVVQTTTTRRVLPVDSIKAPDFFDYIEKLSAQEWEKHLLYIYRRMGETGPMTQMEKCTGTITLQDGARIGLTSQEELEYALAKKFGGGIYRLILKRGSERVCEGRSYVDGPPKTPPPQFDAASSSVNPMSEAGATAAVASQAMHTIANQEQRAVAIGMDALTTAANVVKNFSQAPTQSATDEAMKQMMVVMMQRALQPPPDPMEAITKVLALVQQLNPGSNSNPVLGKIMDAAVEKILNPSPSGPSSSTGAELVRALPQIASYASQALTDWRAGSEAQLHTAEIMRGGGAPPNGAPAAPNAPSTVLPAPRPNPVAPQVAAMTPSLEWVESKIIEILKEPLSAEEAADEVGAFLDRLDPTLMGTLASQGEAKLVELFQQRPVLRAATSNMPRLLEFIRAFLKYAATSDGAPNADASSKPN